MLTYLLEHNKQKPLYLCLYAFIRKDIESGILKPNEKLPSKRNLAEHLHISVITVQNAYTQLIVEGYIYPIARKGY
ncbi:MAG TPA: GntR family transcriptional regulator, partial [Flexilinea sp.]|nr:GntR family transcriptional regulator [Flexilinea sp.]